MLIGALIVAARFVALGLNDRDLYVLAGLTITALLSYGLLLIADSFHLLFAVSHQPFAISHQLSATSYFAFITGYASHLVADSTTKAGIRPELLVGASAGAINAAFLAADPTPAGVRRLGEIW